MLLSKVQLVDTPQDMAGSAYSIEPDSSIWWQYTRFGLIFDINYNATEIYAFWTDGIRWELVQWNYGQLPKALASGAGGIGWINNYPNRFKVERRGNEITITTNNNMIHQGIYDFPAEPGYFGMVAGGGADYEIQNDWISLAR